MTRPEDYGKVLSKDMSWTVDAAHMAVTDNAFFMHCLPVRRNMIVTDDVIEAPTSLVIPEAANREIFCNCGAETLVARFGGITVEPSETVGGMSKLK